MRVTHVNAHTYGGAGMVAIRLHNALRKAQINSQLVTAYGIKGKIENHFFYKDARIRYFLKKQLSVPGLYEIAKFFQGLRQHPNLANKAPAIEVFSPLHYNNLDYSIFSTSEIIHLHYINGFLDYERFFSFTRNKRFVWTVHDMNPISGGCHYSDGCLKFETDCVQCPQLQNTIDPNYSSIVLQEKEKALSYLKDDQLTIVSPSKWLLDLSRRSRLTSRFDHRLIDNPGFNVTVKSDVKVARERLGISPQQKVILFAADNLKAPRKGIRYLFEAVNLLAERENIVLLGIGHKTEAPGELDVRFTGSVSDQFTMAEYYTLADCFVSPALAENSPLVIIEALMCGTPVIASDVGGIRDLIDNENGVLVQPKEAALLGEAIIRLLYRDNLNRDEIKIKAQRRHDPAAVAGKYDALYREILNKS